MESLAAWILFPLLLYVLAAGTGLLAERAAGVHVDRDVEAPRQLTRGARMVEVDVGEQDGLGVEALPQALEQGLDGRLRAGVHEHSRVLPAPDHPLVAEVPRVDDPHEAAKIVGWIRASRSPTAPG